jgi:zeaxanthin glucosyltransferase
MARATRTSRARRASALELRVAAERLLTDSELRDRSRLLGSELRATPGRDRARAVLST